MIDQKIWQQCIENNRLKLKMRLILSNAKSEVALKLYTFERYLLWHYKCVGFSNYFYGKELEWIETDEVWLMTRLDYIYWVLYEQSLKYE